MTREQLIASIQDRIGLTLRDYHPEGRTLGALSPNGEVLFTVSIGPNSNGEWSFGGTGDLLKDHWTYLCRLGR